MFPNIFVRLNILVVFSCCYHNVCERLFCRTNGCPSSLVFPSIVLTVFPTAFMCLSYYLIFLPMIFCFPSSRTHMPNCLSTQFRAMSLILSLLFFSFNLHVSVSLILSPLFFLYSPCVCVTYIVPTVFSLISMCLCHLYCPHCFSLISMCLCHLYCPHCFFFNLHVSVSLILSPLFFL